VVGGGQIDILDPDARAPDHPQALRRLEQLGVDLGAGPDHQGFGIGDEFKQLLASGTRPVIQFDARGFLEDAQSLGRELVGNQYLHCLSHHPEITVKTPYPASLPKLVH